MWEPMSWEPGDFQEVCGASCFIEGASREGLEKSV